MKPMPILGSRLTLVLAAVLTMVAAFSASAADRYIVLASTTSTEQTGLFDYLVPTFRESTGIDVRVVAVGTGQAMAIGRRGDADVILVHDLAGEERFVEHGYGVDRRDVMYNHFIVVGPAADPAGVARAESVLDAFQRIAKAQAPFASRGDDSGTHRKELELWEMAGVAPSGRWYRELGSGMGPTLNTAAAMDAYVLADRGSWLSFRNRQTLTVLHQGDEVLFNPYGSILVNPERHPHVRADSARQWHEWLTSAHGQQAIAAYALHGEQLFVPNAR